MLAELLLKWPLIRQLKSGADGTGHPRAEAAAAALSTLMGSLITRLAWVEAGKASVK